jgi:transposase
VRLLVHVLLAKYVDHLPLYRISYIFRQRYGVRLSRQTMADWVGKSAAGRILA